MDCNYKRNPILTKEISIGFMSSFTKPKVIRTKMIIKYFYSSYVTARILTNMAYTFTMRLKLDTKVNKSLHRMFTFKKSSSFFTIKLKKKIPTSF